MLPTLVITLEFDDASDIDWVRHRVVPAVEELVEEIKESGRLDGGVSVGWELGE